MSIDEAIKAIISSHAVGGGAGGLVRTLSAKEAWQRVLVATFIGALSATYLTPFFVWTVGRYFDVAVDTEDLSAAIQGAVSFCVGMVSISLSGLIEMIVERFAVAPKGKEK